MHSDCPECQRLWRDYAAATTEHIRLDGKLRLAALDFDHEQVALLTPQSEAAGNSRKKTREAIRQHERNEHGPEFVTPGI